MVRSRLLSCAVFLSAAFCTMTGVPERVQAQSQPEKQLETISTGNMVADVARKQGVSSCADRIGQVTDFLGYNQTTNTMLMVPPSDPDADRRVIPVVMAIPVSDGDAYVSANFAPNQTNGCGATYDAIVYWSEACETVAATQFAMFKDKQAFSRTITVLDGGLSTKIFLMTAGQGCVSVKKEVVL